MLLNVRFVFFLFQKELHMLVPFFFLQQKRISAKFFFLSYGQGPLWHHLASHNLKMWPFFEFFKTQKWTFFAVFGTIKMRFFVFFFFILFPKKKGIFLGVFYPSSQLRQTILNHGSGFDSRCWAVAMMTNGTWTMDHEGLDEGLDGDQLVQWKYASEVRIP